MAESLFARLEAEWESERPQIVDASEVLRVLSGTRYIHSNQLLKMTNRVQNAILTDVTTGCGSDELRELITVIDVSNKRNGQALEALCSAYSQYHKSIFSDELRECQSYEQFARLTEDLEFVGDQLKVDVTSLLEDVSEAKDEFAEQEELYADQMQDEWKERWRDEGG